MNRKKKILLLSCAAILAVLALVCGLYFGSYYHADDRAMKAMETGNGVTVTENGNLTVFSPGRIDCGFVFYPGGKVESQAYAPLMAALAKQNVLCVLVDMPLNMAVFQPGAALKVPEKYPDVKLWYIGGHSLGGAMAASCAADDPELFEGLALLGAYSTADLKNTDLKVISLTGTEDRILNRENYEKYRDNLPDNAAEISIKGGNHSFFGSYGLQKGDGIAAITPAEQTVRTAAYLAGFFK